MRKNLLTYYPMILFRSFILISVIIGFSTTAFSQDSPLNKLPADSVYSADVARINYFDELAIFNFDDYENKMFREYLQSKVVYPKKALRKRIQGKVYIRYTVDSTGLVKDPAILKGVPELNQAALNTFIGVPKYIRPAYKNGKPVSSPMVVVISFKIE